MKRRVMLFGVALALTAVGTIVNVTRASASSGGSSCPTANCNGGNYKCCSNSSGDTWYLR